MNKARLEGILDQAVISIQAISGGDIALAQKVVTKKKNYFVKSASFENAKKMFENEVLGLKKLAATHTIGIPSIIGTFQQNQTACLILEFIETKQPDNKDGEEFGRKLAQLHCAKTDGIFGFKTDNYIGKLPQINTSNKDWAVFWAECRLSPQLNMAFHHGRLSQQELPAINTMISVCRDIIEAIPPSLLHGDLWSGNYLISKDGQPYLIDPAVYYGHNEVDLAMTKLFGGFSEGFYRAYHEIIPPHQNQKELVDIYQLYYLLVHLNLFGTSYRNPVVQILKRYFL